jgi:hypothetical protein
MVTPNTAVSKKRTVLGSRSKTELRGKTSMKSGTTEKPMSGALDSDSRFFADKIKRIS